MVGAAAPVQEGCGSNSNLGPCCAKYNVLPVPVLVLHGYSGFLSQSKDMHVDMQV